MAAIWTGLLYLKNLSFDRFFVASRHTNTDRSEKSTTMAGICGLDAFNTKYNDIPRSRLSWDFVLRKVPSTALEILTLQLDLRLEDDSDTSIEVYTYDGVFGRVFVCLQMETSGKRNRATSRRWSRCPFQ
jgi:hypothetical protein